MGDDLMWRCKKSEIVHTNNWFKVTKDEVTRHNDTECDYYVVRSRPSVFIAPFSESGIYLIKQYRYAGNNTSWELPAGGVDSNEDVLEAAQRELLEETGFEAKNWLNYGTICLAPGLTDNICHIFSAMDLTKQPNFVCQEDEAIIDCQCFNEGEIKGLIKNGEITDGPTLAVLARVLFT